MTKFLLSLLAGIVLAASAFAEDAPERKCAALRGLIPTMPDHAPGRVLSTRSAAKTDGMPAFCEARGYIAPQVGFAVRLPDPWNGKLLFRGCGGMCGEVRIERADDALKRGYATATTDMGHSSSAVDALWAYRNPDAEVDFAHRATHVSTLAAKALARAYYASAPQKAYFQGCSTGGRQGLIAATRYPDDFDGIIAGAPIIYYGTGAATLAHATRSLMRDDGSPLLSAADLDLLGRSALAACDGLDGSDDGVIEDPRACTFSPAALQCQRSKTDKCLSEEQIVGVEAVYAGLRDRRGRLLEPGRPLLGSEPNWLGNFVGRDSARPLYESFIGDVFRYLMFDDDPGPRWTLKDLDVTRDLTRMRRADALMSVRNPDLTSFNARGGKLIMYHGWRDQSVLPEVSTHFYDGMTNAVGGLGRAQAFARLFMIPGMDHCAGGPGAHDVDWLSALEAWVEAGKAPDEVIGRFPGPENGTRPHYPYPDRARLTGAVWIRNPVAWETARK
jgi:feruloyl esterase